MLGKLLWWLGTEPADNATSKRRPGTVAGHFIHRQEFRGFKFGERVGYEQFRAPITEKCTGLRAMCGGWHRQSVCRNIPVCDKWHRKANA